MQNLSQQIKAYLEVCAYEKGLSPNTVKAYRIDLTQFAAFTGEASLDLELLNHYIKHLNQNFAPRSAKRKLASVRAFLCELELNGILPDNPFHKLHIRIQTPKQLPRIIPQELVESLLRSAYGAYIPERRETLRDIFVLELLFSTGLRVSELCELTADTFRLGNGKLRLLINGKGQKERIIQIATPELLRLAESYCAAYSDAFCQGGCQIFLLILKKQGVAAFGLSTPC